MMVRPLNNLELLRQTTGHHLE